MHTIVTVVVSQGIVAEETTGVTEAVKVWQVVSEHVTVTVSVKVKVAPVVDAAGSAVGDTVGDTVGSTVLLWIELMVEETVDVRAIDDSVAMLELEFVAIAVAEPLEFDVTGIGVVEAPEEAFEDIELITVTAVELVEFKTFVEELTEETVVELAGELCVVVGEAVLVVLEEIEVCIVELELVVELIVSAVVEELVTSQASRET